METTGNIGTMDNLGTMETQKKFYKNFDGSRKISMWAIGAKGTMGIMGSIWSIGTLGTVGTMGTMENGEKMKMGSRNLRTQQTWLLNVIIKFGSLMSS